MNIFMITDDLFPGGAAKHVVELANGLQRRGHHVTVAAGAGEYRTRLDTGIPFHHLLLYDESSLRKSFSGIVQAIVMLKRLIDKERYEIIHSHKRVTNAIVSLIPRPYGAKHITSVHNLFTDKKLFTRFGDHTICCSEAVRRSVIDRYGCPEHRATTIHYGVHPFSEYSAEKKKEVLKELEIPESKIVISSIGLFSPYKDRKGFIRAVALIKERENISQVQFILQGYGNEQQELEQLIHRLHLEENIKLVPHDFSSEAIMNISQFLVLNSKDQEGFPIVILEAASIGKMHIGTSVGGIQEFILQEKTGVIIPPQSPEHLASEIIRFIKNPAECRRMGENARESFFSNFGIETMIDRIEGVYNTSQLKS